MEVYEETAEPADIRWKMSTESCLDLGTSSGGFIELESIFGERNINTAS